MFDELMLHGDTMYGKSIFEDKHVMVKIRLPWYRCLPLSVVDRLDFVVDGREIPSEMVRVMVLGEPRTLEDVKTQFSKMIWSNLDTQDVMLTFGEPLAEGDHEVALSMRINIPYKSPQDKPPYYYQYATTTKKMRFVRG
jgi:hypothetical protein